MKEVLALLNLKCDAGFGLIARDLQLRQELGGLYRLGFSSVFASFHSWMKFPSLASSAYDVG